MKIRHLDAKRKGEYKYDYKHDILLFKIRDREYDHSAEFDNFVLDIDKAGFVTGIRIFDASQVFKLSKLALNNVKRFEFNSKVEKNILRIDLKFRCELRNKPLIQQGQKFMIDAIDSNINDSEVICTVA